MAVSLKQYILPAIMLLGACGEQSDQQTDIATVPTNAATTAPAAVSVTQERAVRVPPGVIAPAESLNKLFKVSVTSELDPVVINQLHSWTLHLQTADGKPVEDAVITTSGSMPAHTHGMSTSPKPTANLGDGEYLVEGIQFQMGGYWEVKFNISSANLTDEIVFGITLR